MSEKAPALSTQHTLTIEDLQVILNDWARHGGINPRALKRLPPEIQKKFSSRATRTLPDGPMTLDLSE